MSQEDIEGVKAAWAAISANDLERFLELADPELEFTSLLAEAEAITYRGHDGMRTWWTSIHEAFTELRGDPIEIREVADEILAEIRLCGTIDGTEIEQTIWQVLTVRDGLVVAWSNYRTEEEALKTISRVERNARLHRGGIAR